MKNFSVLIIQDGKLYVAKNLELGVVSQGETVDEALNNIKEATELYLENEKNIECTSNKSFLTTLSV